MLAHCSDIVIPMTDLVAHLAQAINPTGLAYRGYCLDRVGDVADSLAPKRAYLWVLVGFTGGEQWSVFAHSHEAMDGQPEPLDRWSARQLTLLAERLQAEAIAANDRRLALQQLAVRAEGIHHSPLGLLMHPRYGLWHAYRGALRFNAEHPLYRAATELAEVKSQAHACQTCALRPCLNGCPVNAFDAQGFHVERCGTHLSSEAGRVCLTEGCQARDACPVGREFRYSQSQRQFHIQAFARAIGVDTPK
jgi:hypothetical protein